MRKCPICGKEIKYGKRNNWYRANVSKSECGVCARTGSKNSFFGKTFSPASLKKKRLSLLSTLRKRSKDGCLTAMHNPEACRIIESYGKEHGLMFRHATNGGEFYVKELGYWLDGYDEQHNVAIEYYERHHLKHTERDEQRKREIVELLGCKFIEIWFDGRIVITGVD